MRNLDWAGLETEIRGMGQPPFRAKQVFQWVQQKGVSHWEEMTNVPKTIRDQLAVKYELAGLSVLKRDVSKLDGTVKYLLGLKDGETVETVLMAYEEQEGRDRKTVCVSTQVGCPLGCSFCATGKWGFIRNLEVNEILGQVLAVNQDLSRKGEAPVTNLVFMGMGEPLLNYDHLIKSLRILNHPDGLNISLRRISVSTSGIVPGIRRLAQEGMPLVLAVSLHAPNNELRDRLMPINRRYPLEELLDACYYWVSETNRRITFEYILLAGINDNLQQARELAELLKGLLANVNLIPYNGVAEAPFRQPSRNRITAFRRYLEEHGVTAVVREERGSDIAAACGQLRGQEMRGKDDYQI
ncbi:MAG: 23S rRNA (adenine(2503)-C(2))-methyltransferase RlmN [Clostridia bacterium]|nr:23S rRNA (adenine(2503)-C(2))-methyltransferase RlmN [Clostridia bacterium]